MKTIELNNSAAYAQAESLVKSGWNIVTMAFGVVVLSQTK